MCRESVEREEGEERRNSAEEGDKIPMMDRSFRIESFDSILLSKTIKLISMDDY